MTPVIPIASHPRYLRAASPVKAVKHDRCAQCDREIRPRDACAMVDGTIFCNVACWIKREGGCAR